MHYDYIIIGSGAGGSAAAFRLAKAGKRVCLIEKGRALPVDGSTLDFHQVIRLGSFKSREPWLDKHDKRFVPEEYFNLGGKTKWYGAALLRFDRTEFMAEPEVKCLGWPIAYEDLAPYYDEVERLLGVRCFDIEPDLKALGERIDRQNSGWRSSPLPLALNPAILSDGHETSHFDGFASVLGLKAEGQTTLLGPIAGRENFTLITGQKVVKLIADEADRRALSGVLLENGQSHSAHTLILAAGALHSPRLIQAYFDANGLTGTPGSERVGGYFKRHLLTAMLAFSPSIKTDSLRKTTIWSNDRFKHSSIQPLGFGEDVLAALLPAWLPRRLAEALAARAYGFFLQTEDGSDADNRVFEIADGDGTRQPKLDYDPMRFPALALEHRRMIRSFQKALRKAGCISFSKTIPLSGTAHACGTLAAGNDPKQSVVDRNGKVHGLANLYVADGSILPRSSRVNPALTIYAWALRTADHLLGGSHV
ncbi:MAG: GMC oxidoreductase [Gammaproteobacteria bacterium]